MIPPETNLILNEARSSCAQSTHKGVNRRFPKITGEDNLTVFSYSGVVKSSEGQTPFQSGGGSGEEPICEF